MLSPCKDCQQRFIGCHSECLLYKDWKQKLEVQKTRIKEEHRRNWEQNLYGHKYSTNTITKRTVDIHSNM